MPADSGRGLAARIAAVLPQTQCTRCGYADCDAYAAAIAGGEAAINRCPPGGSEGVRRLAAITAQPALPLDADCGQEGPLRLAVIDEAWCIGCTLCIAACPVDCIVGTSKRMHTVVAEQCTGCELCLPACPVDCIGMVEATPGRSGWDAWSPAQATQARERYAFRRQRLARERQAPPPGSTTAAADPPPGEHTGGDEDAPQRKRALVEAAIARARIRRA